MAQKQSWSFLMAIPLALATACTGGVGDGGDSADTVRISLQARYEKRALTKDGFGPLNTLPARYCWTEVWRSGDSSPLRYGNLGTDGTGWVDVPRGITFQVRVLADITLPATSGNSFFMHGSVKSGPIQGSYASGSAFNQVPTWSMESLPQLADSSFTLSLLAREDPFNADGNAGPFAIADQMATFAEKTRSLEPTLNMPDLHAFWNNGNTGTAYPMAALDPQGAILKQPATTSAWEPAPGDSRPIYQHKVRYAGLAAADKGADAYNDSLLQETFARLFFSSGIIRSDNDADAYIDPAIASESTIAFASGFGNFLSCAYRNDPYLYDVSTSGQTNYWRVDQHQKPTLGGEFFGNSIARSLWGIWKNGSVFNSTQAGLQTLWDATNPSLVNQSYEFGNAPLGCYPTYLVGLRRLAVTRLGALTIVPLQEELWAENVGGSYDATSAVSPYYGAGDVLWSTISPNSTPHSSYLATVDNSLTGNGGVYYDLTQAQAWRFTHGGGARTITVSTAAKGLIVELIGPTGLHYDSAASRWAYAYATSSTNGVIQIANLPSATYAVRVRLDPYYVFNGSNATYSLTVN